MGANRKIPAHCPTCGKVVDKLRSSSVGIFSGQFLYFCSKECKDLFTKSSPARARRQSSLPPLPPFPEETAAPDEPEREAPRGGGAAGGGPAAEGRSPAAAPREGERARREERREAAAAGPQEAAREEEGGDFADLIEEIEEIEEVEEAPSARPVAWHRRMKAPPMSDPRALVAVQAFALGVSYLFFRISFLKLSSWWFFLPLATAAALQLLFTLREMRRCGPWIALDSLLLLAGGLLFAVPFLRIAWSPEGSRDLVAPHFFTPSGIFMLQWIGRALEEYFDRRLARGAGLRSIYEHDEVRALVRGGAGGRSSLSRASLAAVKAAFAVSLLAAAGVVIWHAAGAGSVADTRVWAMAACVSLALCPRLVRGNVAPAFFAGVVSGRARGIGYASEKELEKAALVDVVVFRKRGGIADERTRLLDLVKAGAMMEESLLSLSCSCEAGVRESEIAAAIVEHAAARGVAPADVRLKRHFASRGIHCTSPHGEIIIGSRLFLVENGISLAKVEETARERERRGESVVFLSVGRKVQALFVFSNDLRPRAGAVCERLRRMGIVPAIISGDSARTLEAIADKAGVQQVRSEVPSGRWLAELERIRDTGHRIAIVGKAAFKDKVSLMQDLVIVLRPEGGAAGEGEEGAGVVCEGGSLDEIADAIGIAKRSRRLMVLATGAALLVQVLAAGVAFSGLVGPLGIGGFVNLAAGALWAAHPAIDRKPL